MTPDEFTNQELMLDVTDDHQIYVHDWGSKDAKTPILFLHGGPGSGCKERDKRKFDPTIQRVIFHDQRGSGKSMPYASLQNNTTDDLVGDIEKIAERLNLTKFVLVGGSWGSTLSLAYGIAHPERVEAMIIDGVFTGTNSEIDWLDRGGWRHFFPEVWDQYINNVPTEHRQNPTDYHYEQAFNSSDPEAVKKSAYDYLSVELALLKLDDKFAPEPYDTFDPTNALIEMHYMSNKCFMPDRYIVDNAAKLTMPVHMIQGRYDMVCPPASAYMLNEVLPNGHLVWTINGHLRQHEATNIQRLLLKQVLGDV